MIQESQSQIRNSQITGSIQDPNPIFTKELYSDQELVQNQEEYEMILLDYREST